MLRVIPLGGLGEVGLNTLVLEHGDERLLIDCGIMFPRQGQPGVDIVVPDFTWLLERPEALTGIVLTHAHEDHLGALPYLLRDVQVPVYGTPFTLAVARHRLEEAGVEAELRPIGPKEPFTLGQHFTVEPIRVTHSVPDAVGLVVKTPSATLVHSGDFKLDGTPLDGKHTDLERLAELGDQGVTALLSDSTNAEVPGWTGSERVVKEAFERLLTSARGRVAIAMFGSHLHRVQHTLELAERFGRKVVLSGRSLQRNVELARGVGLLRVPEGLLVPYEGARDVPPEKLLMLTTGAQAELRSGLTGLLPPNSNPVGLEPGDLVILSSRTIPGNEPNVTAAINRLLARGIRVVYPAIDGAVHVSGHASRDEQKKLLETVRPRHFVPIHGELRHLLQHAGLARELGFTDARLSVLTDGDVLGLDARAATPQGRVPIGQLLMRREATGVVTEAALAERRGLADAGLVVAVVVLERGGGKVLSGPTVHGLGLTTEETAALPLAAEGARLALAELSEAIRGDDERVREEVVRGVRRVFKQALGTRPAVLPMVVRL